MQHFKYYYVHIKSDYNGSLRGNAKVKSIASILH